MDRTPPAVGITRRRIAMAIPLLGCAMWAPSARAHPALRRDSRALMGTQVDILAESADAPVLNMALEQAWSEMTRLSKMMSRYDANSTVSAINLAAGVTAVVIPPELMGVLNTARHISILTGGAFDITVGTLKGWRFDSQQKTAPPPEVIEYQRRLVNYRDLHLDTRASTAYLNKRGMALDLGGIAKLPILAAGLEALQAQGVENALINGGGDVVTMGLNQGKAWRIGIRDPRQPSQLLGAVAIEGQGVVASSGDYERCFERDGQRYHHVLNPRTGWPTTQVHGVALVARDVAAVNGWGTALMVQGPAAAPAWSQRHPEVALLLADRDGQVWQNASMAQQLQTA